MGKYSPNEDRARRRKRRAIELLTLGGLSLREAAKRLGVGAGTISDWARRDPVFRRELEEARKAVRDPGEANRRASDVVAAELARRAVLDAPDLPLKQLIGIHDRLRRTIDPDTENPHDDSDVELTPEEAERAWAELDRERKKTQENASANPSPA